VAKASAKVMSIVVAVRDTLAMPAQNTSRHRLEMERHTRWFLKTSRLAPARSQAR
jgi:hypothetical protein